MGCQRKQLIGNYRQYKTNLHTHSNISDGTVTPQWIKDTYKAEGYSIVAYTDHEVLVSHQDLNDADFLALTGYEISINDKANIPYQTEGEYNFMRVCHLNLIARDPQQCTHVCVDWSYVPQKYKDIRYTGEVIDRTYSAEVINKVIREANEQGFLVIHNHPRWSMESYADYSRFQGLLGYEIYNAVCTKDFTEEYNPDYLREILMLGRQIYPVAADDSHTSDPDYKKYRGFVMLEMPEFKYDMAIRALEQGDFYASTGPLIHELYYEAGCLHLHCSPVKYIWFATGCRRSGCRFAAEEGELLTHAEFQFPLKENYVYVRIVDERGKFAHTRAYFSAELC